MTGAMSSGLQVAVLRNCHLF